MSKDTKKTQELQKASATYTPTPLEEMESWFENLFPRWMKHRWGELGPENFSKLMTDFSAPSVDVVDRDKEILVRMEVPGINKADLDISVTDDTIAVKGSTRKEEQQEEKGVYYRREISTKGVDHIIRLPAAVNAEQAKASLKDGVLEITLTKQEDSQRRKVEIS
ncbi:MAG: Hsp20/alpha crystallin family protein [Gammaproteobacteria bacterium]|nr:Hsp20/alpha crystallin family protein [Gammaproteobacteria bacterium]MBU1722308.1 Hsp20/alpha crystallin family protein [Gammaproteobacteria bacterium]MBU2006759.1 Hsp20/alpha crystallin family protein [Gammaproteobacteria bacterium]